MFLLPKPRSSPPMNRLPHVLLPLVLCLVASASPCRAESRPLSNTEVATYFRLGEMGEAGRWFTYYTAAGANLEKRLQETEDLAATLGAPAPLVAQLHAYHEKTKKYPHATPFLQWPDALRVGWVSEAAPADVSWTDWLRSQGLDRMFIWWLGRFSFQTWFVRVKEVTEYGYTAEAAKPNFRGLADSFKTMLTDVGYAPIRARLNPEALAQMQFLSEMRALTDSPNGKPFGLEELNRIDAAARKLRALVQEKKLLNAP